MVLNTFSVLSQENFLTFDKPNSHFHVIFLKILKNESKNVESLQENYSDYMHKIDETWINLEKYKIQGYWSNFQLEV